MLTSLGFDTLVINNGTFHSNIIQVIDTFSKIGINNFVVIFDYDPLSDSISIIKSKMNSFKLFYAKKSPRRVKIKCAMNMHITPGAAFNDSINQIYCDKNSKIIFISLPLFTDVNYDPISLDINHILYKKSSIPIFTSFEKIVESSNIEFCSKFIENKKIALSTDINYLFNPDKKTFFTKIINSNTLILPSISSDIANYAGALASAEFILEKYGKKTYYSLCSQINKTSFKISF